MEKAIEKAIEGGYDIVAECPIHHYGFYEINEHFLMDANFWKCLVKGLNILSVRCLECNEWVAPFQGCSCDQDEVTPNPQEAWLYISLQFHTINLTDGWDMAVVYLSGLANRE